MKRAAYWGFVAMGVLFVLLGLLFMAWGEPQSGVITTASGAFIVASSPFHD